MSKKPSKQQQISHEVDYIAFLEKRLGSNHFRSNESPEVIAKTEDKLKKARLKLRLLQGKF